MTPEWPENCWEDNSRMTRRLLGGWLENDQKVAEIAGRITPEWPKGRWEDDPKMTRMFLGGWLQNDQKVAGRMTWQLSFLRDPLDLAVNCSGTDHIARRHGPVIWMALHNSGIGVWIHIITRPAGSWSYVSIHQSPSLCNAIQITGPCLLAFISYLLM